MTTKCNLPPIPPKREPDRNHRHNRQHLGQIDQKKFDFLYATTPSSKGVPVNFTFAHKMAKLVLTVKVDKDVAYSNVASAVSGQVLLDVAEYRQLSNV